MSGMKLMHICPRYYRLCTDPGVERAEVNYGHAFLDWRVPVAEAALVCVDVWAWCGAKDAYERTDRVTREKIAPLVGACREHGLRVIHAPAYPVATKHANWVRLLENWQHPQEPFPGSPEWPPVEFKKRNELRGEFAPPHEPQEDEQKRHCYEERRFHPAVEPVGDEAVIVNGEELHRLCAEKGILHLFYVGFHTNMCMVLRDYAPLPMRQRGYNCVLVRDCTTGMEVRETTADMMCTRGTIATFEQEKIYTVESGEMMRGLEVGG